LFVIPDLIRNPEPIGNTLDPRVKPEDDNLKWLFLFVIPAGLKRESSKSDKHFNFFTNEPKLMSFPDQVGE
jgi:hypothetical protein